jgi:hypothetical protein
MSAPRWLARFNLQLTNLFLVRWRDMCPAWEWSCTWAEKHIDSTARLSSSFVEVIG